MLKLWRRPGTKNGIWIIRGTLRGQPYWESTGTNSKPHAEAIFARRHQDLLDAATFGPERLTCFAEAVTIYLSAGGEARFLEPLVLAFGPRRLADITQSDVLRFITERYPTTGPAGLNRQVFTPLIAVYNAAHKARMGPAPCFQRPDLTRRGQVRFAPDAHIERILPKCSERLVGAIMLMTLGGARVAEACRVVDTDIDWTAATVLLRKTKNGKPRVIQAGAALMLALRPLRGRPGPLFGFAGRHSLNQALERACLRAGLEPYSSHEIGRHAFAARLLAEGRTLLEVQKLGGWQSYRIVAETYGHLEQSSLDEASRATGANFVRSLSGGKVNALILKR